MNIHDWHRRGLKPAFATVEQWIIDQLGYLGAEDEGCFAMELRSEKDARGLAVRVLVASDKGLFDILWERPDKVAERRLSAVHYRWADVRSMELSGETRINPETLKHGAPRWSPHMDDPPVDIERAEESAALLEFWSDCSNEMDKAARQ